MSATQTQTTQLSTTPSDPSQPLNLGTDLKPQGQAQQKVKPCCVCTEEKSARDECMLFSNASDPQEACGSLVDKYRACMKGYGFNIN